MTRIEYDGEGRPYEVMPRDESLVAARGLLDRLYGDGGARPDSGEGVCDECREGALVRFTFGAFTLCRVCVRRRRNAARQIDQDRTA